MIINLYTENQSINVSYESNITPRVGETITLPNDIVSEDKTIEKFYVRVLEVHHLIDSSLFDPNRMWEVVVNCKVDIIEEPTKTKPEQFSLSSAKEFYNFVDKSMQGDNKFTDIYIDNATEAIIHYFEQLRLLGAICVSLNIDKREATEITVTATTKDNQELFMTERQTTGLRAFTKCAAEVWEPKLFTQTYGGGWTCIIRFNPNSVEVNCDGYSYVRLGTHSPNAFSFKSNIE